MYHNTFDITNTIIKKEKIEESVKILMNTSKESELLKSIEKDLKAMIMRENNHLMKLIKDLNYHLFRTLEELFKIEGTTIS